MGYELVQGRIEQADGNTKSVHSLKDALEVTTLQWQQLVECYTAAFLVAGDNHLAHSFDAVALEEHVLSAAQTNTLSTKLASNLSVAW